MALNKRTVKELAAKLKLDAAKVEAALDTPETDETKQEDKSGEIIAADLVILPKAEFSKPTPGTFFFNWQQQKYESGRTDGLEAKIKGMKEALKIPAETAVTTLEDLLKHATEQALKEAKLDPNQMVENLKKDKDTLQGRIQALELELGKAKTNVSDTEKQFNNRSKVLGAAAKLNIDAPDEVVNGQRNLIINAFMSEHTFADDGSVINKNTGKPLQDDKLNNLDIEKALLQYAPTYVKLKDGTPGDGGRGDRSTTGTLPVGDVKNIKTMKDLEKYLTEKQISATSDEALGILREVRKDNPSFK